MNLNIETDQLLAARVIRIYKLLPTRLRRRALRPALLASARVYRDAVKITAPVRSGSLRRRVKAKAYKSKKGRSEAVYVISAPYGHQVESGHRGGAKPTYFWSKAFAAAHGRAEAAFQKRFITQLVKIASGLIGRHGG